jgi:hypothetical protein
MFRVPLAMVAGDGDAAERGTAGVRPVYGE